MYVCVCVHVCLWFLMTSCTACVLWMTVFIAYS
uniref:Uncharacterized protein n=1 Tax=Anguilla anguilla TaxID=7936 RepID=A0A0E9R8W6_ANGAN